jgi:C-terminal processing protease CtpA/Prc
MFRKLLKGLLSLGRRPALVVQVKQAIDEWFVDREKASRLEWSKLGKRPSVEEIRALLDQLGDPHTFLMDSKEVVADEQKRTSQPSLVLKSFGDICYLSPNFHAPTFADDMMVLFTQHICHLQGLILDLRKKPGGELGTSLVTAAVLMPRRPTVLCTMVHNDKHGQVQVGVSSEPTSWLFSRRDRKVVSWPYIDFGSGVPLWTRECSKLRPRVVVLVDGTTASSAEVVAAAIHAHGRGELVGVQTYGKGVCQEVVRLRDDDRKPVTLHITVGKVFTPKQQWLGDGNQDRRGLIPEHWVEQQAPQAGNGQHKDTQLQRAFEILRS